MAFVEYTGEVVPYGNEDRAIKKILELEGGFNPRDPVTKKPVNFGIDQQANPDIDVSKLTKEDAVQIYRDRYWKPSGADKLPEDLALVHFNAAVNMGVDTSKRLLKESGGDVNKYLDLQKDYYRNLAETNPEKYGSSYKGWLNRTKEIEKAIGEPASTGFVEYTGEVIPAKEASTTADIAKTVAAPIVSGIASIPEAVETTLRGASRKFFTAPTDILSKVIEGPFVQTVAPEKNVVREVTEKMKPEIEKTYAEAKIPGFRELSEAGEEVAKGLRESRSPEVREAIAKSQFTGDLDPRTWSIGEDWSVKGVGYQALDALSSTIPIIATALITKKPAIATGIGGAMGAGEAVKTAREYIDNMSDEELLEKSAEFRDLAKKVGPEQARKIITDKASEDASIAQGVIASIGSNITSKLVTGQFDDILLKSVKNRLGRIALGTAGGMTEEGLQELSEGIASDLGIDRYVARKIGTDAFANLVLGALGGAAPGGIRGAVAREGAETVAEPAAEPTAEPAPETPVAAPAAEAPAAEAKPSEAAQDYEAMLAELEGKNIPIPVAEKQLSEEIETVEPTPAELNSEPVRPVETPKIEKDEFFAKLDREDIRNELKYLAENAGWAQVGGRILREDAEDQLSPVVGRTKWIPKQEWWTGRPATKSGSGELNERQTQKAVEKALNGQPLNAKERRMIEYMLNVADTNISAYEEYAQQEREALEDQRRQFGLEAPTPEDLRSQEEAQRARESEAARIEAEDKAERERQEIRRLGERGAEDFALGRTAAEDLMGQTTIFEQPTEEDIDAEMARKAEEGRAEMERRKAAGEKDYDVPFNIERKQTSTPEFKKWFGKSKVSDESGKPLVVYHGSTADFSIFKNVNTIESRGDFIGEGFFFHKDPYIASKYANVAAATIGGDQSVYPAYLSIQNPLIINSQKDAKEFRETFGGDEKYFSLTPEEIKKEVEKRGYDGLIDNLYGQYAVFNPNQIKSAIGNRGTFSPDEDSIVLNIDRITEPQTFTEEQMKKTPSLRVEMNRLLKANREGKIAPETFALRTEQILDATKKEREFKPRERGQDIIISKLRDAVRRGEIERGGVELAEWFMRKNPDLVQDLAITIKQPKEGTGASGYYNPMARIMVLLKGSQNETTAVHEIMHHLERMMPAPIQKSIRKAWVQSLVDANNKAQKGEDATLKIYFKALMDYHFNGDAAAMPQAKKLLQDGSVDYDYYQYINPSEFWAVNATDIMQKRFEATNGVVPRIKRWLSELVEAIKGAFGFSNNAPVIKALNSLIKGDGKFVSKEMLGQAVEYENLQRNFVGGPPPKATWQSLDDTKMKNWTYRLQDKNIDLKDVQKAIQDDVGQIEDQWDAYMKEELYHGRNAKRVKDFLKNDLQPILRDMANSNISLKEMEEYLHNRHAEEYNDQIAKVNPNMPDGGSGIMTKDARDYMAKIPLAKRPNLERIANKIDKIVYDTQEILVKTGVEEQSTIDAWRKTFPFYVPLKRGDLDYIAGSTGLGGGFATRGSFSKRATGSAREVVDILANIAIQREIAIQKGEQARVGRALMGLAIKNPNPDFWLPVNPEAIKDPNRLAADLSSLGLSAEDAMNLIKEPTSRTIDPRTGLVSTRPNIQDRYAATVFPVRINGKDWFLFFNPNNDRALRMVKSLRNLDADRLAGAIGLVGKTTRWVAAMNTQYNPVFGAWNFTRDVGGATLNLSTTPIADKRKQVMADVFPALFGIYSDLRKERKGQAASNAKWAKLWEQFQKAGGQTGIKEQFAQTENKANIIEREMKDLNAGNVRTVVNAVAGWLSDYNDAMENAVRLAAFKAALDKGLSEDRAASIAKNLTVNFNRKGAWTNGIGALYAFFNASVQGSARIYETLKGPAGKKIIAGGLLLGTLQAVALALAGFDEDQPPEFLKDKNLIIPLLPFTGDGKYLVIPMPLGFSAIPAFGRRATEMVMYPDKLPEKVVGMFGMVLDAFNPIGSGSFAHMLSPTVADPFVSVALNEDPFGRPIYKEDRSTAPTPGYSRSREGSSILSKYLAEFLNYASSGGSKYQKGFLSPTADEIDYVIGQYLGGVGREIGKFAETATGVVTGEEVEPSRKPVIGKIIGDIESKQAVANKFYNNVKDLAQMENEIKGRAENKEDPYEFIRQNPKARFFEMVNDAEKDISNINKDIAEIRKRNPDNKEAIKRMEESKLRIMRRVNQKIREAEE